MEFYAQPCVQPTRLWRERVGAIFGKLGYAKIVLKLQSRRAANAPVVPSAMNLGAAFLEGEGIPFVLGLIGERLANQARKSVW